MGALQNKMARKQSIEDECFGASDDMDMAMFSAPPKEMQMKSKAMAMPIERDELKDEL